MPSNEDWLENVPTGADPHADLFELLERAVARGVFPGCVAMVYRDGGVVYEESHGVLADHPSSGVRGVPVSRDTVYDLASLTKVLSTTSLIALAVSEGRMRLDDAVPSPWSRACPGATLVDLLEHCAGLAAHREYFTRVEPFDADRVLELVTQTEPEYPLRQRAVYSDLGFIILGAWLERVYDEPLDRIFADRIAYPLDLEGTPLPGLGFRRLFSDALVSSRVEKAIAPTEVYDRSLHGDPVPSYLPVRERVPIAHGAVHDDNCYVMGGVAGHAGLFGTAQAVLDVARAWLAAPDGGLLPGLDHHVRDRFWQPSSVPGSTRRLGFDGPNPDGSGSAATAVTSEAVGHTGFTGTSLWIDPAADGGARIYVLLSNRVHPTRQREGIAAVRRRFHVLARRL